MGLVTVQRGVEVLSAVAPTCQKARWLEGFFPGRGEGKPTGKRGCDSWITGWTAERGRGQWEGSVHSEGEEEEELRPERNLETPVTNRMGRGSGRAPGWERWGTLLPFRKRTPILALGVPSGQRLPCKGRDSSTGPQTFHYRATSPLEALTGGLVEASDRGCRPGLLGSCPHRLPHLQASPSLAGPPLSPSRECVGA